MWVPIVVALCRCVHFKSFGVNSRLSDEEKVLACQLFINGFRKLLSWAQLANHTYEPLLSVPNNVVHRPPFVEKLARLFCTMSTLRPHISLW